MALLTSLFNTITIREETPTTGSAFPLSLAPANQELELVEVRAGRRLTHRLAELGLTPGVRLRVIQRHGGPLLVSVRGSRIAVGRGMAHKLMVVEAK